MNSPGVPYGVGGVAEKKSSADTYAMLAAIAAIGSIVWMIAQTVINYMALAGLSSVYDSLFQYLRVFLLSPANLISWAALIVIAIGSFIKNKPVTGAGLALYVLVSCFWVYQSIGFVTMSPSPISVCSLLNNVLDLVAFGAVCVIAFLPKSSAAPVLRIVALVVILLSQVVLFVSMVGFQMNPGIVWSILRWLVGSVIQVGLVFFCSSWLARS